jgi:4-amino-4-deoxy-L-arabinose transferase-like glycosyltransferase
MAIISLGGATRAGRMRSEGEVEGNAEPRASRVALGVAAFILSCWAMLALGNAPIPILHDMAEAYAWGQEFQLGYNQHPPLWAWLCGAWFAVAPRAGWSFAALDALNAGLGLAGAWSLIGDFARGEKRMAAFALLLLTPIYTLGAYKYDANTIFLSIWPWTTHAFVRALRTRGLGWSLGFGALAGAALLCKYYAALLIATCGLGALACGEGRAYLRSASPWVSAVTAAALFAPHAAWLMTSNAPPVRYFQSVANLDLGLSLRAALAAAFGVASWFAIVVAVVAYFARREPTRAQAPPRDAQEARLMAILGLAPLALTFAAGLALRVRLTAEMPIGGLALIPLVLIDALGPADARALAAFARRAGVLAVAAMTALSPAVMLARAYVGEKAARVAPYPEVAQAVTRLWRARVGAPLPLVAGDDYAHYVAFYSPDRPHAFFGFSFDANLWVRREDLSRRGWIAVCDATDAPCLANAERLSAGPAERVTLTAIRRFLGHVGAPRAIVVFLSPPRLPKSARLTMERSPTSPGVAPSAPALRRIPGRFSQGLAQ